MPAEWGERVDVAMGQAGVPSETLGVHSHVIYRGPPVDIPVPDDFPAMGYLRHEEISFARRDLAEVRISAMSEDVRSAVMQLSSGLDRAQALKSDLVFFSSE